MVCLKQPVLEQNRVGRQKRYQAPAYLGGPRLSGNKISAEQAQKARHAEFDFLTGGRRFVLKAMDAMSEMSTEERSSNSGKAHLPNMLRTSWKKRIWRPTSLDLSQALTGASM